MGYGSLATGANLRSPKSRCLGGELNVVLIFDVDELEERFVWQAGRRGCRGSDRFSTLRRRYPHLRLVVSLATAIRLPTPALPAIGHSRNRARMLTTTVR
jgi:hypothetical protein